MALVIERLKPAHKHQWHILWQGYLNYYNCEIADDVSDETWHRLLDPDHVVQGFGAVLDGHLVGIVHYLFHPVTWSTGPRCYLEDLFTSKDARGQGVGRALIAAVHREAQKAGADQVYWLTESHNRRAQALYDKVATKTPFIKYAQVL